MSEQAENKSGQIQIADEVIAIIARTAATEVEGVYVSGHSASESLGSLFGKNNLAKGVKVKIADGETEIEIEMSIKFGTQVLEAAENVQIKVKNAVETMTGLVVSTVNVSVSSVIVEKNKATEEIEDK